MKLKKKKKFILKGLKRIKDKKKKKKTILRKNN